MQPGARSRSATRMSPGTAMGRTVGKRSFCRWRKLCPSRVPASESGCFDARSDRKTVLLARRIAVHGALDYASEVEQAFLDQHWHVADIGCRLAPLFEDARLPGELTNKLLGLCRVGRLILCRAQLLGLRTDVISHRFFLAGEALYSVHHVVSLRIQGRIEGAEQRFGSLLPLRAGSDNIVRDQLARFVHGRSTRGKAGNQVCFL